MLGNESKDLKQQWIKKKLFRIVLVSIFILALFIVGAIYENYILIGMNTIFALVLNVIARNKMLVFIEKNTYNI